MHDPTAKLQRLKLPRPNPDPPTADEFRRLVVTLRNHRDRDAGDLVELMAYSGLRLSEACGLKWQDVDFDRGIFYIAGKGRDETERDVVPLFPAMRELLLRIRQARKRERSKASNQMTALCASTVAGMHSKLPAARPSCAGVLRITICADTSLPAAWNKAFRFAPWRAGCVIKMAVRSFCEPTPRTKTNIPWKWQARSIFLCSLTRTT